MPPAVVTNTGAAGNTNGSKMGAVRQSAMASPVVLKRGGDNGLSSIETREVSADMAGEAERARAMEKVRGALGTMPAAQRRALEMAYFEGLTHIEIAAQTGEPLGTIKTRIRTALLALRKTFVA